MKTSEKIKELRISKGLSQEQLGELIGVKRAAINKYETGRVVNIKRTTLQKLADVLGVRPADLLDDVDASVMPDRYCGEQTDPAEEHLLSTFRQLNDEGQEKLVDYADDLAASGRYKKGNSFEVVEEEA